MRDLNIKLFQFPFTVLILKIGISVGLVCLSVTGILVALCCFKKKKKRVKEAELEYTRLAE